MQGTQVRSLVWEDAAWGNQAGMPQLLRLCSQAPQEKPVPHNQREPSRHKEDPAQPKLAK